MILNLCVGGVAGSFFKKSKLEPSSRTSAQKSVSLHLETRQEERERMREQQLARENKRREARGLPPLESTEDLNDLEPVDVVLDEAAEIVADMIKIDTMVYSSPDQRPALLN